MVAARARRIDAAYSRLYADVYGRRHGTAVRTPRRRGHLYLVVDDRSHAGSGRGRR
jgi:hypothetical protein